MKRVNSCSLILMAAITAAIVLGCTSTPSTPKPSAASQAPTPSQPVSIAPPPAPVQPPAGQQVFSLTLGYTHPSGAPDDQLYTGWVNWIQNASNGRIKIKQMPSGVIAKGPDQYNALVNGLMDLNDAAYNHTPGRFPLHEIDQLPFLFEPPDSYPGSMAMWALQEKYPEFQAEHAGVKVLGIKHLGANQISFKSKAIHTLEDLKGLTIIENGAYQTLMATALGAKALSIPGAEQYDSVAKGIADGIDVNYLGLITNFHIDEVINYSTLANTAGASFVMTMNMNVWNKLPSDLQALFIGDNARKLILAKGFQYDDTVAGLASQLDQKLKARGKEGVYVLPAAEKVRWIKATQSVFDTWVQNVSKSASADKAKAMLEDLKKFTQQYQYTDALRKEAKDTLHSWGVAGY